MTDSKALHKASVQAANDRLRTALTEKCDRKMESVAVDPKDVLLILERHRQDTKFVDSIKTLFAESMTDAVEARAESQELSLKLTASEDALKTAQTETKDVQKELETIRSEFTKVKEDLLRVTSTVEKMDKRLSDSNTGKTARTGGLHKRSRTESEETSGGNIDSTPVSAGRKRLQICFPTRTSKDVKKPLDVSSKSETGTK